MAVKFKNSININDQYTFPSVVGTDGQYLSITDAAAGTLDWTNIGDIDGLKSNFVYYDAKNSTGSTIPVGTAVMAVGSDGNSGHILIAPMNADGSVEPKYFIGVADDNISNGQIGKVVHFGIIDKVNTNAFSDGDVLWCDPANPGGFTTTEPTAPAVKIASAIVVNSSTNGKLLVRVQGNEGLHELHDVNLASVQDGQFLTYDAANGYWKNSSAQTGDGSFSVDTDIFTGNNSTTDFTLSYPVASENNVQVYIDGVYQSKDNYTTSGTTLSFSTAPPSGVSIEAVHIIAIDVSPMATNEFVGDGTTTTFALSDSLTSENRSMVFIEGVYQEKSTYSISGTDIVFTTAPQDGYSVEVMTLGSIIAGGDYALDSDLDAEETARIAADNTLQSNIDTINAKDPVLTVTGDASGSATFTNLGNATLNLTISDDSHSHIISNVDGLQSALDLKASISYVDTSVANLIDSAPGALDTLNELAAALGDDANFAGTVTTALATKVDGTGTANYISKWSDSDTLTNSLIYDNGTNVGIGTSSPNSYAGYTTITLNGTTGGLLDFESNGTRVGSFLFNNASGVLKTETAIPFIFATADTERMRITSDGTVYVSGQNNGFDGTLRIGERAYIEHRDASNTTTSIINNYNNNASKINFKLKGVSDANAQVTILGSGNVGIGTSSPDKILTLSASDCQIRLYDSDGTNQFAALQSDSGAARITSRNGNSSGAIVFQGFDGTVVSERMRIDSAGNVGIGTSSPTNKLSVYTGTDYGNNSEYANATIGLGNAAYPVSIRSYRYGGSYLNGLDFYYNNGTPQLGMRINSSGNVGIGTNSPSAKLEVNGITRVSGDFAGTGQNPTIQLYNTDTSLGVDQIIGDIDFYQSDPSGTGAGVVSKIRSINSSTFQGEAGLAFHTGTTSGLTERMRIDSTGNVGIGTYNPAQGNLVISSAVQTGNLDGLVLTYNPDGASDRVRAKLYIDSFNGRLDLTNGANVNSVRINSSGDSYFNGGNVGIGTSSPIAKLHIQHNNSSIAFTYGTSVPNNPLHTAFYSTWTGIGMDQATAGIRIVGEYSSDKPVLDAGYYTNGTVSHANWNSKFIIRQGGNVGIGTTSPSTKLQVAGTVTATALTETSALRFKENIQEDIDASIIDKLRPVSYDWKEDKKKDYGFIAEEVNELDSTLTTQDEEGEMIGIKYTKLIPFLVKKIQEQEERIKQLENGKS